MFFFAGCIDETGQIEGQTYRLIDRVVTNQDSGTVESLFYAKVITERLTEIFLPKESSTETLTSLSLYSDCLANLHR